MPTPREARRVATRERAFSLVTPQLWNDLPEDARLAPTYLFSSRSRLTPSPRQLTCVEFVLLLADPRIVVLIWIFLFLRFDGFKFCILVFNVYCL